jgi:hypothetical protein
MRLDWFIDGFSSQYEYNTPVEDNPYDELVYRYSQSNMGDLYNGLVIFINEWQLFTNSYININSNLLHDVCKFAKDYGYVFDYPQNRVSNICSMNVLRNLFNANTAEYKNLFINTSIQGFGTPAEGQTYYTTIFRCLGNTKYKITKNAGHTFRIATSVNIPARDVSYISTSANHTGTEIEITTESNANYIGITFWSNANGDSGNYLDMANSIVIQSID